MLDNAAPIVNTLPLAEYQVSYEAIMWSSHIRSVPSYQYVTCVARRHAPVGPVLHALKNWRVNMAPRPKWHAQCLKCKMERWYSHRRNALQWARRHEREHHNKDVCVVTMQEENKAP